MTKAIDCVNESVNPTEVRKVQNPLLSLPAKLREEVRNKGIDLIVYELGLAQCNLQLDGKKLRLVLRHIEQKMQQVAVEQKIETYNQFRTIFAGAVEVAFKTAAAFAGVQTGIGVGLGAAAGAADVTKNHFSQQMQGTITGYEHVYTTRGGLISDHVQQMREEDQNFDRVISAVDQFFSRQQRIAEQTTS